MSDGAAARAAWRVAATCLVSLIFLCVTWELFLAPIKPGGSWLVLKVLPLLAALFGVLRARRYTFQWTTLAIWFYVAEGAARAWTDAGLSSRLAAAELVLAFAYFGAAVAWLRSTRAGAGQTD